MSERFDHVLFWVFFPANAPTLKLFFSKFLVPVDTSYMPVIIKNIVVSDLRAELGSPSSLSCSSCRRRPTPSWSTRTRP